MPGGSDRGGPSSIPAIPPYEFGENGAPSKSPSLAGSLVERCLDLGSDKTGSESDGATDPARGQPEVMRQPGGPQPPVPQPPHFYTMEDPDYREVVRINDSCALVEQDIVEGTRVLLEKGGITLEDPKDVKRAVNMAMTSFWEGDIDGRLQRFRNLRGTLGKGPLFKDILKELRSLGNQSVPDPEEW